MRKHWLITLTCCLLCFCSLASAERIRYKDSSYPFKEVQNVRLVDLTSFSPTMSNFREDAAAEDKLTLALRGALAERKLNLVADGDSQPNCIDVPQLTVKLYACGYQKSWQDGWVERVYSTAPDLEYAHYRHRPGVRIGRRHGGWHGPIVVFPFPSGRVEHPAGYYYTAYIDVELTVKDPKSNKTIYSVRDTRVDGNETNTTGMLRSICNDFARDISK